MNSKVKHYLHTLVSEHGRTELELIQKPISSGIDLIVSGGATEAAKGEKQLKAPSNCQAYNVQQWSSQQYASNIVTVALLSFS